jgi:RNA polymerase sigma-70 factor (ECF subfamily)
MSSLPPPAPAPFACVAAAWQAHEGELRGYLRHRTSDADLADDILQDVFLKAMRQGQGFCGLDNPRAWLFQVARNALVDRARTSHPHEPFTEALAETTPLSEEALPPVDALADCLTRTINELSAEDQWVLRACDLSGLTQREFADQHGLSLSATKSRLLRARQRLRDRMSSVCRIQFDPQDGHVLGHQGRSTRTPGSTP